MAISSETDLHLTREECEVLVELLRADLSDLREEVYKTERYEWRQELKRREGLLNAVLERLDAPAGG